MPVFFKLDRTEVSPPGVPKIRGHPESRKIGMPMRFTRPLSLVSQNRQEGQIGIGSDSRPDHSPVDHSLNVGLRLDVMDGLGVASLAARWAGVVAVPDGKQCSLCSCPYFTSNPQI